MQGAASEAGPDTALAMCCGQAGCWTDGDASEAARRVSGLSGRRSSGGYPSIRNSVPMRGEAAKESLSA